jgi:tetratricopeptide (TPR) repeat protein
VTSDTVGHPLKHHTVINRNKEYKYGRIKMSFLDFFLLKKTNIGKLFSEFDKDLDEERKIDDELRQGIDLANSGKWLEASEIFKEAIKNNPDFHTPHIWLSDYIKQTKGTLQAIEYLKESAKKCRKKSRLLEEAAEIALLECNELKSAIHLFAQSLHSMNSKPQHSDISLQRACLFMKEIFASFGDLKGVYWANRMQNYTYLDQSLIYRIDNVIIQSTYKREMIKNELTKIREHLIAKFPQ